MSILFKIRVLTCCAAVFLLCSCAGAKVRRYGVEVVGEYPHDVTSYTQGLFFHGGQFYESTGQYGHSSFRKVDLKSGKALRKLNFSRKYFVEGSVILGDRLYILTWTNKVIFVYDAETLEYKATYTYPREGWGLTTDGEDLIATDGSSTVYFLNPQTLAVKRTVIVKADGRAMRGLNELEYIDGKIWANVYTSDMILVINPEDGNVEGIIDASGLLPDSLRTPDTDVLNGIACNPDDGKIYLTGKNWPKLYEIRLVEKR